MEHGRPARCRNNIKPDEPSGLQDYPGGRGAARGPFVHSIFSTKSNLTASEERAWEARILFWTRKERFLCEAIYSDIL